MTSKDAMPHVSRCGIKLRLANCLCDDDDGDGDHVKYSSAGVSFSLRRLFFDERRLISGRERGLDHKSIAI